MLIDGIIHQYFMLSIANNINYGYICWKIATLSTKIDYNDGKSQQKLGGDE